MGIDQHWHVVEWTEEMGGTTPWRADESGRSCRIWPKNTKTQNTPKKKKTREKQVEVEGEIRKGRRAQTPSSSLGARIFLKVTLFFFSCSLCCKKVSNKNLSFDYLKKKRLYKNEE